MNVIETFVMALELDTSGVEKKVPSVAEKINSIFNKIDQAAGKAAGRKTFQQMLDSIAKARDSLNNLNDLFKNSRKHAADFANFVRGAFGATMFSAAIAWASEFMKSYGKMKEEVRAIGDLSKEVGAKFEDVAAWSGGVEFEGYDVKAFQDTLATLKDKIASQAKRENSKAFIASGETSVLEALHIDASKAKNQPIFDLFRDISNAINGMDKTQGKDLLKKLGINKDTIKFIQEHKEDYDELISREKEWAIYTKKDTEALEKFEKSIKQINHVLKTTFIPLFSKIIGVSSKVMVYVSKAAIWLRNNLDIVKKAVILLALAFSTQLAKALRDVGKMLIHNKLALFIMGLTMLLLLLEDFYGYTQGKKSAFGGLWEKLGDPKEAKRKAEDFLKTIKNIGEVFDSAIAKWGIASAIVGKLLFTFNSLVKGVLIKGIPIAMGTAATVALALLVGFIYVYREELMGAFNFFKNAILDIPNIIKALINELSPVASEIADFLTDPIPKIKKAWIELKEWFIREFGSLDKIMSRMTNYGHAAQVARERGGVGNITNIDDHSVNSETNNYLSEAAVNAAQRRKQSRAQANRGQT